ncbi:efflux RND transporter periplasmic adaptor subunit [Kordiimonas aestuarii]|uniref:efflux RND transporter periplasmic adaptor subunit n=1 Tax=Kordiimonas aestuarii TaxID=1005925 RepID=UPI0021D1D665|nr:efflux RND transporter periplasmic adaptor subunit [Kordiimonas aestuarii]
MNDKSELLGQLKIDRSQQQETKGTSPITYMLGGGVVVALLLGGAYFMLGMGADTPSAPSKPTPAAPAQQGASTPSAPAASQQVPVSNSVLNASGYITARRMATVSAEVIGLITDVTVEEGMSVKAGQVLARLDPTLPQVDLDLAEAQVKVLDARLQSTQANLTEAKRVLKRATELKSNDFSTEATVSRAQADVESLTASLASARADIDVAKLSVKRQRERLDDHTIRAPFDGVVTVKAAQPGEIVSPSSAGGGFTRTGICTIVDMTSLEIEVDVNESFIGRVFEGQAVNANLDAYPNWDIPASVIAIIPTADRAKATVRVRVGIKISDPRILPDMGVKVAFMKA